MRDPRGGGNVNFDNVHISFLFVVLQDVTTGGRLTVLGISVRFPYYFPRLRGNLHLHQNKIFNFRKPLVTTQGWVPLTVLRPRGHGTRSAGRGAGGPAGPGSAPACPPWK